MLMIFRTVLNNFANVLQCSCRFLLKFEQMLWEFHRSYRKLIDKNPFELRARPNSGAQHRAAEARAEVLESAAQSAQSAAEALAARCSEGGR